MSSSPAQYEPPEVPSAISETYAQKLKQEVREMVIGDIANYYPEVVVSYASGRRPNDAEGTGPGFVHGYQFIKQLKQNGISCFSGLHVPAGGDWETFFLRLRGAKAKAKVFIALLNYAYFDSIPCMMELHAAIEAKVEIVLVRMEDVPPRTENQWKAAMKTADDELARREARKCVGRNAIPHPGTLLTAPKTFGEILSFIRESCKCDAPARESSFEHGSSSSKQGVQSAQVKTNKTRVS